MPILSKKKHTHQGLRAQRPSNQRIKVYLLNHINDLGHVIRDTRFHRRRQALKVHHILMKFFTITPAQTNWILPQFICSGNYLHNLKIEDSDILSCICNKQLVPGMHSCGITTTNTMNKSLSEHKTHSIAIMLQRSETPRVG